MAATLNYKDNQGVSYLKNCTCNYESGARVNNLTDIEITADNGYYFETLPNVNIYVNNSIGIRVGTLSFNSCAALSADGKRITFNTSYSQGSQWVISQEVRAAEQTTVNKITLTYDGTFTDCTANFSKGSTDVISEQMLQVFADEGFIFKTPAQNIVFDNSVTRSFSLTQNGKQLYCEITESDISSYDTAVINGDFTAVKQVAVGATIVVGGSFTNCSADFTDGEVVTGERVLTITANTGFEFNGAFYCETNTGGKVQLSNVGKNRLQFEITEDMLNDGLTTVSFNSVYAAVLSPKETMSDFVRVFNPTDEELSQLSKSTFYNLVTGSSVPISSYITALYKIPFDVSGLRLPDKANIVLGNYDSKVQATMLDSWVLVTDGGEINVKSKYNNVFDYINTDCNIYIPYFGKASIDIERVLDCVLTITYYTNLYEGYATVDVVSTFGNNKVFTATKKIGFDVPYVQLGAASALTDINIPIFENELTAFVEVIRNVPIENSETFGKKTVRSVQVSELAGYQVIDDISFIGEIPYSMQTEIRQILRGGVFI